MMVGTYEDTTPRVQIATCLTPHQTEKPVKTSYLLYPADGNKALLPRRELILSITTRTPSPGKLVADQIQIISVKGCAWRPPRCPVIRREAQGER